MRLIVLLAALVALLERDALGQQTAAQLPTVEFSVEVLGTTLGDFSVRMDSYAELRRSLEKGLPALTVSPNPSQIYRTERLLAERIRRARAGARRGNIFTEDIRHGFRQLLRRVIDPGMCAAIRDDNPGEFPYQVNADYPKTKAVSTVAPSVIPALPVLPEDVYYRFVDRDLILHDLRANIILDRIDDAIRCDD